MRTIDRVKKRFIEEGFEVVLERRAGCRVYDIKLGGDVDLNRLNSAAVNHPLILLNDP